MVSLTIKYPLFFTPSLRKWVGETDQLKIGLERSISKACQSEKFRRRSPLKFVLGETTRRKSFKVVVHLLLPPPTPSSAFYLFTIQRLSTIQNLARDADKTGNSAAALFGASSLLVKVPKKRNIRNKKKLIVSLICIKVKVNVKIIIFWTNLTTRTRVIVYLICIL